MSRVRAHPALIGPSSRHAITVALHMPNVFEADLRVLLVCIELTATQRKFTDETLRSHIAKMAGVSEKSVTRALAKFEAAGIFEWSPAKARGRFSKLTLVKPNPSMHFPLVPGLTRDTWKSRVQLNAGHGEDERGTPDDRTRDTLDVPQPSSTHFDPPLRCRRCRESLNDGTCSCDEGPIVEAVIAS